jgi:hypothetical protein
MTKMSFGVNRSSEQSEGEATKSLIFGKQVFRYAKNEILRLRLCSGSE